MKTTYIIFSITLLLFACSKDDEVPMEKEVEYTEMDTSCTCTAFDNNFSDRRFQKFFTKEELKQCDAVVTSEHEACLAALFFDDGTQADYSEGSDIITRYSYTIEGDSVKLYTNNSVNINSFFIKQDCEQRLVERDGDKWFLK